MKIIVTKNSCIRAINHCKGIVAHKTTIPILNNILIETKQNDSISFSATDLELSFIAQINAQVARSGRITVSGKILSDVINSLPDNSDIVLEINDKSNLLQIHCEQSNFELPTLDADTFPDIEVVELAYNFKLPGLKLAEMINKTAFAMSTEETRFFLNGVFLHAQKDKLCAAATDGHRLASVKIDLPEAAKHMPGIIISRKAINQIQNIANNSYENDIEISLSNTQISIKCDNYYFISRLVDGVFPDYEKILPTDFTKTVKFNFAAFDQAVERVSILAYPKDCCIKLTMGDNKIVFSAENSGVGLANEQIPAQYQEAPIAIGFNYEYLLGVSKLMKNNDGMLQLREDGSPIVFSSEVDKSAIFAIMPMRI